MSLNKLIFAFGLALFLVGCSGEYDGISPEEYITQNNLDAQLIGEDLYIVIHEQGSEEKPTLEDVIEFDFIARLANTGEVFSDQDGFTDQVKNQIPGLRIGLQELGVGGEATIIIPPSLGFGPENFGNIPGKSVVVYDVKINKVNKSVATIDEYIDRNNLVTTELDEGVHIIYREEGDATRANIDDIVRISYEGRLTNELVFDQSDDASFQLSTLINGWIIGLQEIGIGGDATLLIPAEQAFGDQDNGPIPANSPVIFDIKIIDVERSQVDIYIEENNLETRRLDRGVHIIVHEEGDGVKPNLNNAVNVTYEGRLIDGTVFDAAENITFELSRLITGWQIGIPEIGINGSCTLIIPPSQGYGNNPPPGIPSNAVLIFDLELNNVL